MLKPDFKIVEIINEIKAAGTPKKKKEVLEKHRDSSVLQTILYYTYNPYLKYGISRKVISNFSPSNNKYDNMSFYSLLDELAASNINDSLRQKFVDYVNVFEDDIKEIMIDIATKDLNIGISKTTINKVWENLIPTFDLQLAAKFWDTKLDDNEYIWITEKFDGVRCVCIIDENRKVKFLTRQGKEIEGLNEIKEQILEYKFYNAVFDGELLFNGDAKDSGERYRKTTKITNSKDENKTNITFNIFDIIPLNEFKIGQSQLTYSVRRQLLNTFEQKPCVTTAPVLYEGTDHSQIIVILNQMISESKEGCMVNRDHVYQCKRTKSLLKVKNMSDVDLRVVGAEEGRGENEGKLGAFIVEYKNNVVNVGSGFSKLQREEFWKNKEMFIGSIIKVQYFEESQNADGKYSLRFPVFIELRPDKREPSYN